MISIILYLLIFIIIYLVLYQPQLMAKVMVQSYPVQFVNPTPNNEALRETEFRGYKVYRYNEKTADDDTSVVIYLNSGAFIMCNIALATMELFKNNHIVVTFEQPTRFNHTTKDIIQFMADVINDHIMVDYKDRQITFIANSASGFYMMHLVRLIDADRIEKIFTINGFFGSASVTSVLLKFAQYWYIERSGDLNRIPLALPVALQPRLMIISTQQDYEHLKESTRNFAEANSGIVYTLPGGHVEINVPSANGKLLIDFINVNL